MAYDIGTARGVIEMEYNGRGINEAQEDLEGLKKQGGETSQVLRDTGRGAGIAGAAIAGGLALAVNSAANFEQRMSAVEAVSGATEAQMAKLSDKALQLGKDTAFSATESASAIEELVKAGLSVEDVLNGAADATVALAAAGEVDLPTAATIASNAMNQFNLNAKDMVGVADSIAGAANASAIDVNDFGQSLSQSGAVANLVGLSFDDLATAIALMGNAGIKGSDAGTSLKTMLSNLQPDTDKQRGMMKELGLITQEAGNRFFDAEGNLKSFAQISGILADATEDLSKKEKTMALQTIFGSDAIRAAAVIADSGAKGFRNMNAAMGETTAAEVAATRMDNLKGRLEELKGSAETVGIAIGTALMPVVESIVGALTRAADWFLSLTDAQQKWVAGALAAAAGALLLIAAIAKIIIFIGKVQAALAVLRGTMIATWAAALGPIALVIAAVAAVIAIVILLWKKSETFRDIVLGVWDAIKTAAAAVASWFMGSFVPAMQAVWDAIVAAVKFVWGLIVGYIRMQINIVKTVITTALNVIRAIWGAVWGTFGPIVRSVWNLIVAVIRLAWTIIKGLVIMNVRVIVAAVTAAWNAIRGATSAVWNAIRGVISSVWGAIRGAVTSAVNAVKSAVSSAWNTIKSITTSIWNAITGAVGDEVEAMLAIVRSIQDKVVGFFSGAASWLYNAGRNIIQGLIDGISSMIDSVTSTINGITDRVAKFLPGSPVDEGPLKVLNRGYAGKQIVKMMIDGIEAMAGPLASAMDSALSPAAPAGYASPGPGSLATPRRRGGSGARRRATFVDGELRLGPSGRAFISGVAADEVDDDDDYDDTLERMGRG